MRPAVPPESVEPAVSPPGGQDLLFAVLPAMLVPFLGSLIYFVAYAAEPWAPATYALVKLYTLGWPLLATVLILRQPIPWPDLSDSKHWRAAPLGLLIGVLVCGVTLALNASPIGDSLAGFTERIRMKVSQLGVMENYLAFSLFLAIVHSAIEEYYWRWFVFGTLRQLWSFRPAAAIAGVAFASHHVVILSQYFSVIWTVILGLMVAAGGYLWCLLVERQRTLMGAWLSHVLVDLAILWVGYQMLF